MKKTAVRLISSGLFSAVAGLMLVLLRGSVLNLIITVIGIGFIVKGILYNSKHLNKKAVLRIILGVLMVVFGNTFINLSMYLLGIAIIVWGLFELESARGTHKRVFVNIHSFLGYALPILNIVAGLFLLVNPMGSIETVFLICGISLFADGVSDLLWGIRIGSMK